jgi:transcriptional regulator with XRE-family HTH domain
MAAGESPAVARRRVRLALRKTREERGLTQGQVAEAMEWSLSKVMRIESGEVTISLNDLRPLLVYLDIVEPAVVDELMQAARVSRRRKEWSDEPKFREYMTPAMRQLVQFEAEATRVRHFNANVVPGWLQLPEYARAILEGVRYQLSDEQISARLEARRRRREGLLARKRPPSIFLLVDESVTLRQVGSAEILANQLDELLRLIRAGRLVVRLVPFVSKGMPFSPFAEYDILEFGGGAERAENAVIYREGWLADDINDSSDLIARYLDHFNAVWGHAEDEISSEAILKERAIIAREQARSSHPGVSSIS